MGTCWRMRGCRAGLAAWALAMVSLPALGETGGPAPLKVCLAQVEEIASPNTYRNFNFTMVVTGSQPADGDGLWIAAIDGSGAYFVQQGGGIMRKGKDTNLEVKRKFGVSNSSAYPLVFTLVKSGAGSMPSYKQTRDRAGRVSTPTNPGHMFSDSEIGDQVLTDPFACQVELDANDKPDASGCKC